MIAEAIAAQPKLVHGMTVKNPTDKEAKEIFEAARLAGIVSVNSENKLSEDYPWIMYIGDHSENVGVTDCSSRHAWDDIYVTASEFIARIKGEVG